IQIFRPPVYSVIASRCFTKCSQTPTRKRSLILKSSGGTSMRLNKSARLLLVLSVSLTTVVWTACNKVKDAEGSASASAGGKIPVTTTSDEARKEFLQGRSLAERLLGQESIQHFDKALSLDPDFALAELARANNSPTA